MSNLDFPTGPSDQQIYTDSNTNVSFIYSSSKGAWKVNDVAIANTISITFGVDGGGSALTTGQKGTIEIPFNFDVIRWTLIADQTGSANVDVWSREYSSTVLPTSSNTVTVSGMNLNSAVANQSNDLSGWAMTRLASGNVLSYNVQSVSTITRLVISLVGYKS